MSLANRSLITIADLSNKEIEVIFSLADRMSKSMSEQSGLCQGKIMASLFFEPSTRTRMSFEVAMHRLGGQVVSVMEMGDTSLSKGESIADMARVVGSYADIIVIRHPWEGAAKVVADYAGVPVINAGDGGHEHPTQTLCDLYTLKKEKKRLVGLTIELWGDLKYGRTTHSLAYALARFGATIHFRPGSGLSIPEHVVSKLIKECQVILKEYDDLDDEEKKRLSHPDAIYIVPIRPHQLALMTEDYDILEIKSQIKLPKEFDVDALYVTRLQRERLEPTAEGQELERDYPVVNKELLKGKQFKETLVMHPLPRIDELAYEIDDDRRSMYFKQAAWGVPIRMALLSLLLGAEQVDIPEEEDYTFVKKTNYIDYNRGFGVKCPNDDCVSGKKTEMRYIKPKFKIVAHKPLTLRCVYCEHETHPPYIASSRWHQGILENKRYHNSNSFMLERIKLENLFIFSSKREAMAQGFKPSQYASTQRKVKGGSKR